jgi:hypothetical protein
MTKTEFTLIYFMDVNNNILLAVYHHLQRTAAPQPLYSQHVH